MGDKVVEDKWGTNKRLVFMYDENGAPNTVYYYNNSTSATKYYYVLNLQGDVTEIRSTSNALVAQYNYDAFGNILSIKDANGNNITSSTHIANVNPLRYRGYFYDTETGFYYLNSRYYDPATRRFISADMLVDERDFDSMNLYSYCGNDPVNRKDDGGAAWDVVLDIVSLGFSIGDVACNPEDPWAWVGLGVDIACTIVPFVSGGGTAVRAATKVDDVVDAGKAVDKVDDVVDATNSINSMTKAVQTYYPPNDGFSGIPSEVLLQPGTTLQRTGDLIGRFTALAGTPPQTLSLPYDKIGQATTYFQTTQPIKALSGTAAPWFDQIGGGTQYLLLDGRVDQLLGNGSLIIYGG